MQCRLFLFFIRGLFLKELDSVSKSSWRAFCSNQLPPTTDQTIKKLAVKLMLYTCLDSVFSRTRLLSFLTKGSRVVSRRQAYLSGIAHFQVLVVKTSYNVLVVYTTFFRPKLFRQINLGNYESCLHGGASASNRQTGACLPYSMIPRIWMNDLECSFTSCKSHLQTGVAVLVYSPPYKGPFISWN